MAFDKNSKVPLYFQLKEIIKERIHEGEYSAGQMIPSEREICQTYGISRMTVRQAINELESEGFLYRVQGRGTFVASNKFEQNLACLTSFSEDMRRMHRSPASRLLAVKNQPADPEVCAHLKLSPGEVVFLLVRLRSADGIPICIEKSYLNAKLVKGLEFEGDGSQFSLYQYLRDTLKVKLGWAHETIETTLLQDQNAKLLDIPSNALGLLIERTTYDIYDTPVEYVKSYYRGDKYKFVIDLKAPD